MILSLRIYHPRPHRVVPHTSHPWGQRWHWRSSGSLHMWDRKHSFQKHLPQMQEVSPTGTRLGLPPWEAEAVSPGRLAGGLRDGHVWLLGVHWPQARPSSGWHRTPVTASQGSPLQRLSPVCHVGPGHSPQLREASGAWEAQRCSTLPPSVGDGCPPSYTQPRPAPSSHANLRCQRSRVPAFQGRWW